MLIGHNSCQNCVNMLLLYTFIHEILLVLFLISVGILRLNMENWQPGPIDSSVLYDQENHVSEDVWQGVERGTLLSSQTTSITYDKWELTTLQKKLLFSWGFGVFGHPAVVTKTDSTLVSALVERWRPETNTFHMKCGEITITLEDVHFILGLPVLGMPISCPSFDAPLRYFRDIFGDDMAQEWANIKKRRGISLVWLQQNFCHCPEKASRDVVGRYTKAYVLWLCGAILFPTRSKNSVHPRYMYFLYDSNKIATYAWGAACLAYLYRGLYAASRKGSTFVNGCVTLLQIWSYERFLVGRPNPRPDSLVWLPRARAWAYSAKHQYPDRRDSPHHHLSFYRGEFDRQPRWEVVWRPYQRWDGDWTGFKYEARMAGSGRVPLIHFDIVEYQMPDRVMRQYGYLQGIPSPAEKHEFLRATRDKKFEPEDYLQLRQEYIHQWEMYMDYLEGQTEEIAKDIPIDTYFNWYNRITRRFVHHPRREGDPNTSYEPRAIYNQHRMVSMVSNFKFKDCLFFN